MVNTVSKTTAEMLNYGEFPENSSYRRTPLHKRHSSSQQVRSLTSKPIHFVKPLHIQYLRKHRRKNTGVGFVLINRNIGYHPESWELNAFLWFVF